MAVTVSLLIASNNLGIKDVIQRKKMWVQYSPFYKETSSHISQESVLSNKPEVILGLPPFSIHPFEVTSLYR